MDQLKRKLCFGDIIVLLLLCFLIIFAFAYRAFGKDAGNLCTVRTDNQTYYLDLTHDSRLNVTSCGVSLTVVIENGKAFVEKADCPDKVCVHSGKVSQSGESIVCIPAKVSIIISTEADDNADWILG